LHAELEHVRRGRRAITYTAVFASSASNAARTHTSRMRKNGLNQRRPEKIVSIAPSGVPASVSPSFH
jgi:hypothetical protein